VVEEVAQPGDRVDQAEHGVQVGGTEVGIDQGDAVTEPGEREREIDRDHALANAALAAADRDDPRHRGFTPHGRATSAGRAGAAVTPAFEVRLGELRIARCV
jgi:hypothetical protein